MAVVSFNSEQIESICSKPTLQQMLDEFIAVRNQMAHGTREPSEAQYSEEQRATESSLFWTSVMLMVGYMKQTAGPGGRITFLQEKTKGVSPQELNSIIAEHMLTKLVEIESQLGEYYSSSIQRVIERAARNNCQCEKCVSAREFYHKKNAAELERQNAIINPNPADMPPI